MKTLHMFGDHMYVWGDHKGDHKIPIPYKEGETISHISSALVQLDISSHRDRQVNINLQKGMGDHKIHRGTIRYLCPRGDHQIPIQYEVLGDHNSHISGGP